MNKQGIIWNEDLVNKIVIQNVIIKLLVLLLSFEKVCISIKVHFKEKGN